MGTVVVRNVRGRYPQDPEPLRSENIEADVVEGPHVIRIRLDDAANQEAWLEITLEIER